MTHHRLSCLAGLLAAAASFGVAAQDNKPVYRCPGPPVLYTDALTLQEARDRGCRTIEGAPVTVVQTRKPAPGAAGAAAGAGSRPADSRVDPAAQRARDGDARRILEAELARDEEKLDALRKEYNNGEPERLGGERNYAKYQERVIELKASIGRKENDIASLKRELSKLPK